MPYISTKTTKKITKEAEQILTKKLGEAITALKGKSEKWLMLDFSDERRMAFAGNSKDDCAMIEIELFGRASESEYSLLTERVSKIVNEVLGIDKDRIYVKYEEISTWGFNGNNF